MIAILDPLLRLLRSHEQRSADQYRLVRPRFKYACDADAWLWGQNLGWPSAAARRAALSAWIDLRKAHHVEWLERGGCHE